jgi:hypothetical protein
MPARTRVAAPSPIAAAVLALALVAGSLPAPARAAAPGAAPPDYSLYQALLDEFLRPISPPGEPLDTRFDYEAVYALPDRDARLAAITGQLLSVNPSALSARDRMAWAINTYNFLVLRTASQNLYERRVRRAVIDGRQTSVRSGFSSVAQMTIDGATFFEAPVALVEGHPTSLIEFERRFLFAAGDSAGRKPRRPDPRVRFAVVPAAKSSPPLLPRAFRGDSLDAQLDLAVRNALANPKHLRWNATAQRLEASRLFLFHATDFGGPAGTISFLRRHAPEAIRDEIAARRIERIDVHLPWDGTLNQTPRTTAPPGNRTG